MDNYIVSARKYRPATFETVIGQHALTTTLKNSILLGKLAHAYLFCGPRGVGKTTCARIFAKTINCEHLTSEGEPCNECESCRSFNEQRSLNIYELDAASNNSVDDIRNLIDQVRVLPQIGEYKVYIIDEVHMLSSQAFNAFLKTLEEPPHHAVFILATTEKQKIIPTILSRCQIYDFARIGIKDITEHLKTVAGKEGITVEEEALNLIAQKADGGMRDALSLFDQMASFSQGEITYRKAIENLNVLDYDYYFRFTRFFLEHNVCDSLLLFNEVLNKGFDGSYFMGGLASHFRDLLVSRDEVTLPLLEVGENTRQRYKEQAGLCPPPFLYKALKLCNDCDLNYRASRNKRLSVELTLIQLSQLNADGDEDDGSGHCPEALKPIFTYTPDTAVTRKEATRCSVPSQSTHSDSSVATAKEVVPQGTQTGTREAMPLHTDREKIPVVSDGTTGISIRKRRNETKETVSEKPKVETENAPFTPEELNRFWTEFALQLPKEDSVIYNHMVLMRPVALSPLLYEIVVENEPVESLFRSFLPKIERFVRKELHNSFIEFEIALNREEVERRVIRRPEQFHLLSKKNENLLKLKELFDLDFQ